MIIWLWNRRINRFKGADRRTWCLSRWTLVNLRIKWSGRKPTIRQLTDSQNTALRICECGRWNSPFRWVGYARAHVVRNWCLKMTQWFCLSVCKGEKARKALRKKNLILIPLHCEDSSVLASKYETLFHSTIPRPELGLAFFVLSQQSANEKLDGRQKNTGIVPVNIAAHILLIVVRIDLHRIKLHRIKGQTRCAE